MLLGAVPGMPPNDDTFYRGTYRCGAVWNQFEAAGIPEDLEDRIEYIDRVPNGRCQRPAAGSIAGGYLRLNETAYLPFGVCLASAAAPKPGAT